MSKTVFHNPLSGETLIHRERPDGTRDLFHGPTGSSAHGHAVLDPMGNPRYEREISGRVIVDDLLD